MSKWHVYGSVVGSKYLGLWEAKTAEEAIDKAMEQNGGVSLCHRCVSECESASIDEVTAVLADVVAALAHLRKHIAAGHVVSERAIAQLEREVAMSEGKESVQRGKKENE